MAHPTEPATPRRLARARRLGDHPTSLAVTRLAGAVGAAALLPLGASALAREARELLGLALRADAPEALAGLPLRALWLVTPVLGAVAVLAIAAGVWQTGGAVSSAPLGFRWERLSPLAPLRRIISAAGVWSALSLPLLIGTLAAIAFTLLASVGPELAASVGDAERAAGVASELCRRLLWWTLAVGLFAAAIDALVQRGAWLRRHRMTREELQREQRESEGDPALRQERRRAHRELLDGAQLSRLPGATLLVFDWPHLAVALRYDPVRDRAPVVVLQTFGAATWTVRTAAELYQILVSDDAALARKLARLPVDAPIPSSSFAEVAALLEPWAHARATAPEVR